MPVKRSLQALDWLNFVLADVRAGVGPFLAVYLMGSLHWNPADIGIVMSMMGIAGLLAQTPCGALVDSVKEKRLLIIGASLLIGIGCTGMTIFNTFSFISAAQILNGVAAAIPSRDCGNHVRNCGSRRVYGTHRAKRSVQSCGKRLHCFLAGLVGYAFGQKWIFYLVTIVAVASAVTVLLIRGKDIDYLRARAATREMKTDGVHPVGIKALFADRDILVFALAVTLFHFGNAAMLPLAGQLLTRSHESLAPINMSACIIAAQLVMIPVAHLSGKLGSSWGRKPVFLIGFAILPIRGLLYTLSANPFFIVSVQLLDGIGAGIFGVLSVMVVADLTRGPGDTISFSVRSPRLKASGPH